MECMICTEDLLLGSVGELDCCEHSFCSKCILRWAEKDSRCPACRGRFRSVTEKMLDIEQPAQGCTSDEEMKHSKQMLGKVLKVHDIPERNQRPDMDDPDFYFSDAEDDPMNEVFCVECGRGDDEHNLLLCDGCDCACHTYCANLDCIPEDEWYCHSCTEERESTNQGRLTAIIGNQQPGAAAAVTPAPSRTTRRLTRAGADEQGGRRRSTPGEVVDLITPEELPSAAERPRQRLRRLYRRGAPASGQGVEVGTTADFLAALEARANSRTAGDAPSHAHRRLENLRQRWGRIRQGQADFNSAVDLTSPRSNSVSGQSSATQVSPDGGQRGGAAGHASGNGLPGRHARAEHASDVDAAFAALDDAMDYRRPSAPRTTAGGAFSRGIGAESNADASSFPDSGKRKRDDAADYEAQERPAIREQARQLRRPQPRERSGLLRSLSRPGSAQEPPQGHALAQEHAAASPSPRSPFTAGSRRFHRAESGRHSLQLLQKSPHEHSSGHLHRIDSQSRLQRLGSGSQRPSHPARPAQSMDRHAAAGLSTVPSRQRSGAQPRDSAFARQPSGPQHPQPPIGPPGAGPFSHEWHRRKLSHPTQLQHQYGPLSGRVPPGPHPMHFGQHSLPFHEEVVSPASESAGGRATLHSPTSAAPLHAVQQPRPGASPDPPSVASPLQHAQQQQQIAEAPPVHSLQPSLSDLPSQHTQPVAPDTQAEVQTFEAWYGGLTSTSQGMQRPTCIGVDSAPRPSPDESRGFQGSQRRQREEKAGSPVLSSSPSESKQVGPGRPRLSEKEAVAVVKPVLKILYAEELLMRQQFTDACKKAVHLLREGSAHNTKAAVKSALSSMGLELAASRVS